jgi:outer membrane protein assembly factor BamB
VATDDERVYVLEARDDPAADDPVTTLVASGAADGREAWAVPFPDGANDVLRYPSVVMVVSPDATSALDPVTGEVRWTAPGHPVAPLGRDRLLLRLDATDPDGNGTTTMTVVDAGTGAPDLSRSGPAPSLTIHPCADAGLVLVSEPGRLTAHDIVDGAERWSVDAQYHDDFHPMVCTADVVIALEGDDLLVARDLRSGDEVARAETAVPGDRGFADLLDLVGDTVVVRADDRLVGFSADAVLAALWQLDLPAGGREAVLAAAGEGVTVALLGDRAVWYGPDAAIGSEVSLAGHDEAVIEADRLVSWGAEDVLVATANDLGRARVLPLPDVRRAAVSSTHLVLTTRDEVHLYPL